MKNIMNKKIMDITLSNTIGMVIVKKRKIKCLWKHLGQVNKTNINIHIQHEEEFQECAYGRHEGMCES
jgi:RNA-binding protein YlmH